MNILCLLWLILLQSVYTLRHSTRITVSGGPDTTLRQQMQPDPSEIHIAADGDDSESEQNVLIHFQHKQKKSTLSPEDMQQAQHITKMASSSPKPAPNPCEREINEMNSAKRERNEMAIRVAALELQLRELQKQNHLLQIQIQSKPNSIKHPIEVPIIIGDNGHTQDSPNVQAASVSKAHKKHKTVENTKLDQKTEASEERNNKDAESDSEEHDKEESESVQNKMKSQWNKWYVLLFIVLLLIPLLVGVVFCFVSRQNNDTDNNDTTFIVNDNRKTEEMNRQNNRDLPFILNEPNDTINRNHYSKESTRNDIQRLSANMNEYFETSPKPVISPERVENDNVPKPGLSSEKEQTKNVNDESVYRFANRMSLVDQQVTSDEN